MSPSRSLPVLVAGALCAAVLSACSSPAAPGPAASGAGTATTAPSVTASSPATPSAHVSGAPAVGRLTQLTPAGTAYFTEMCTEVDRLAKSSKPDLSAADFTTGRATIAETLRGLESGYSGLATRLEARDRNLGFEGADAWVSHQATEMRTVAGLQGKAAADVAVAKDEAAVQKVLKRLSDEVLLSRADTLGLSALGSDNIQVVKQVPACAKG